MIFKMQIQPPRGLVVLLVSLTLSAAGARAETPALVSQGKPVGHIVTAPQPSDGEQFASEQLQSYIFKVSGATLPIVLRRTRVICQRFSSGSIHSIDPMFNGCELVFPNGTKP